MMSTDIPSSTPSEPGQSKPRAGDLLKQGRARQRLSVSDCAKRTHISARFLEALEDNRWKDLPSESHRQGFLRSYARFLGVSHDEVMTLYRQETSAPVENTPATKEKKERRSSEHDMESRSRWMPGSWPQAVGLGIVVLGFAWVLYHQVNRIIPHEPEGLVVRERPQQTRLIQPTQKVAEQKVRITAQTDTWVRVMHDNQLLYEGMLPAGVVKEWSRAGQFVIKIGDVRTLSLFWNDQPVDVQTGARAGVKEIRIPLDK